MTQFEVGKTYYTRSLCDHNCIIAVTITKRTAKTVTGVERYRTEAKTFRPYVDDRGNETIRPWGSYSMSPIVDASDTQEKFPK